VAFGCDDGIASAFGDIFSFIALVIHLRRAGAGGASAGRAIILPFQRDAIAFVHGRLRWDRTRRGGRSKERECGGECGGRDFGFFDQGSFLIQTRAGYSCWESSFGCGRRTVGRQPLDGENDHPHGHEEGTRMRLSRDECENDQ
jgi:hypothetical protein